MALVGGLLAACGTAQQILVAEPSLDADIPRPPVPLSSIAPAPTPTSPTAIPGLPLGFGSGPVGRGLARFYHQQVIWTPCGGSDKCAWVWVPLDYGHPDRLAISIRSKVRPSGDPAHAFGTIFVNPGGPGRSGIAFLDRIDFGPSVTLESQVVGFDPRGVGQSTPIRCLPASGLDAYVAADPTPDSPAEVATFVQQQRHFAAACVRASGPLLAHVSTIETARDMDILRAVVEDPFFNYYGAGYGSYLGATYAALFPEKVGRMVLDGGRAVEESQHALRTGQTVALRAALRAFLEDCVSQSACPLGPTIDVAERRLVELFRQVDEHPLPTLSDRDLTEGLAFSGFVHALSRRDWAAGTEALEQALAGHGGALLSLADGYVGRGGTGQYAGNAVQVEPAVSCLDHPESLSLEDIEKGGPELLKASPVFGPVSGWLGYTCSAWPVKPTLSEPDRSAPGARPMLVIAATRAHGTPYLGALSRADQLDGGVLLTHSGEDQPAFGNGNACIDGAVSFYLTNGRTPAEGTTC